MTIGSVKPASPEIAPVAPAQRTAATSADYATLAASLSRGDIAGARAALAVAPAATPAAASIAEALSANVAEGNLAAARFALAQLRPHADDGAGLNPRSGPDATTRSAAAAPTPSTTPHSHEAATRAATAKIATGAAAAMSGATVSAPIPALPPGMVVADVSAVGDATTELPPGVTVDDVMRALATGHAGSIPAAVINRYGPGGVLYDPAAIMDAYRASPLGRAQMAATAWIGRPA